MNCKPIPLAWSTAIERWTIALRAAGRTAQTIETRTEHIRRLARGLETGSPVLVSRRRLQTWAGSQEWAPETRRSHYASIRSFYRFLGEMDGVEDPTDILPSVKASPPCPRPASERVYRAALEAADPRAHVILRLAGEAGLRRAEIALVGRVDLFEDLTGWSLLVHGKGQKERLVPLSDSLYREVTAYLGRRRLLLPNDGTGRPLTPRHVGKIAAAYLPEGVGLHMLRHRFSARVNAATHDLRSLQVLLGHASLATTERYIPVEAGALRVAASAAAV